jgi:hypothetical protein
MMLAELTDVLTSAGGAGAILAGYLIGQKMWSKRNGNDSARHGERLASLEAKVEGLSRTVSTGFADLKGWMRSIEKRLDK